MAATLTADNELTHFSMPILKQEETPDGNVIVYGKCTDGNLDSDLQVVDVDWSQEALKSWLDSGGNVRVQHQSQRDPAGRGLDLEFTPDGHYLKALIVEPVAKDLVRNQVLRAFSVGISRPVVEPDPTGKARNGIIKGNHLTEICEVSIVDRPANARCGFQMVAKSATGAPEYTGKMFGHTDTITKGGTVSVDLPTDVSVSFSPADLAKLLEHRRVAEQREAAKAAPEADTVKRDFDPSTGGGVDRDKLDDSDFVFPKERVFPVVTPGDVPDAVSSWGRYKGPESFEAFKKNLTALAHRKGPQFAAKLPDAWAEDSKKTGSAPDAVKGKKAKGKKKPFPGAHEPFSAEHQHGDGDIDTEDTGTATKATGDAVTVKGMKDCPKCGKSYDADSKMRRCESCNGKLPKANKTIKTSEEATAVDDTAKTTQPETVKSDDVMCLGCGHELDDDDKFCSECGKPNPSVEKASKPTPDAGAVGADSIEPVPAHREPDGPFIEALEHDAGLPTEPDAPHLDDAMKATMRLKALQVPADMGALHDLLCAAYHPDAATKAHPGHSIEGISVDQWQQKALDAAYGAPMDQAAKAQRMWQHAVTIKGVPGDIVHELRHEAHKAFEDANPGPATFPQPTELSPARFNRPYISAGHAKPGTQYAAPNDAKVPAGHLQAADYDRGPIIAGHEAPSPANKNAAVIEPAPIPPGMNRTYYTTAQRESAREAMSAMHDHIAQTFPDLCPMSGPGYGGQPPEGARPVPVPAGMGKSANSELTEKQKVKAVKKARKAYNQALASLGVDTHDFDVPTAVAKAAGAVAAPSVDQTVIEKAIAAATAPLAAKLAEQGKLLEAMAELPDPREAAFRGVATQTTTANKAAGLPAGGPTPSELAARAQLSVMRAMQDQARNDPDPAQREAAWAELYRLNGLAAR